MTDGEIQALYYGGLSDPVLIPPTQAGISEAGVTVSYTVALLNLTGVTDSFTLTVQTGNIWTTTLSLIQTGPLSDGASLPFTVYVEVPTSASPGDMDAAAIQATSVTSPTVFSDTATISTTVIGDLAYVGVANEDYLALVDTGAHSLVGTIDLDPAGCDFPWQVAIPPDGETVWVSCRNSGHVVVVDRDSNTVATTVDGLWSPAGIGFTHDGAYALVGSRDNSQVVVIDTSTYSQTTIETAGPPSSIVVHPYLPLAYGTDRDGSSVAVIDTVVMSLTETIDAGNGSRFAAISRDGQRLYVSSLGDNSVSVIDTLTDEEVALITDLGGGPRDLAVSLDGGELYVNADWSAVQVIDTSTFSVERTITVDPTGNFERPWGADLTCDGQQLLVTNSRNDWSFDAHHVAAIDTASYTTTALLPMPDTNGDSYPDSGARGIAVCPQYVATGVFLSPPAQTNQGGRGQVVAHEGRLVNLTGASDSFNLMLGGHVWDTALSTDSLGPIANGDSMTFTAYVTVPVGVDWYSTDMVDVTATSAASPTVYSDTATFTTEAYAPPEIGVSSEVLTSTQYVNQVVTKPLTISNGSGVTLTFDIVDTSVPDAVLLMHLDEPVGATTFYDASGSDNHGSCSGGSCPIAGVDGKFGRALSFDGVDDYVEVPDESGLNPQQAIAISAWIYPDDWNGNRRIVQKGSSDNQYRFLAEDGWLRFHLSGVNSLDTTLPAMDVWHHVVGVYDGTVMQIWVDGQKRAEENASGTVDTTSDSLFIGTKHPGAPSGDHFGGLIDEVVVYDRALSAEEVEALYLSGPYSGDVPWLSKDPISGTVTTNSSTPIQVTFDATSIQPGTHTTQIRIRSNDPVRPMAFVSATMTVSPTGDMGRVSGAVSDAWTDHPLTATVELVGVYSMTASPNYTIWAPAGSYSLMAYAPGYYTTTRPVTIVAGDVVVADLALEPAESRAELPLDRIAARAGAGWSSTQTMVISNTGPLPLDFAFHEISPMVARRSLSVSPADLAGKRILYDLSHGEPGAWEYSSLISDATNAGGVITEYTRTIDAAALVGYDVLWVNCCGSGWDFGELSAVSDWLGQGGAVLVHGESNDVTDDPASVFGIAYEWGSCPWGTTTNIADHPISEGVSAVSVQGSCSYLSSTLSADVVVYDPDGQPHIVAQERNGGKMVVVASQIFRDGQIDLDDNRLLANNTLAWLARPAYTDVPWLSETPQAGSVPGHSSLPVDLAFDATGLSAGEYEAILAMEHNDPAQSSPIELPVTLTVFEAQVGLTVTKEANPDPVQAGERLTYTICVTNTGNMDLHATITDTLPADITQGETSGGTLVLPGGVITWTTVIPASGPIWTETIVVTAAVGYTGPLINVVKVATVEGATGTYTETSIVEAAFEHVYLPIVLRSSP